MNHILKSVKNNLFLPKQNITEYRFLSIVIYKDTHIPEETCALCENHYSTFLSASVFGILLILNIRMKQTAAKLPMPIRNILT